jgi:hypothetical protein
MSSAATTSDCPAVDMCGACGTLPPGFVRLRYFFGKRLGVVDFVDEQRYHAGKMRFHNQHLHGAGVLCGLAVTRYAPASLVLRVGRGAALDACGREIIVGYDQCIDVDAWYARVRAEKRISTPTWPEPDLDGDGRLPLCVVLRYRECAAQPEPAPRDPCSCDASGCDLGRVREEFELDLVLESAVAGHAAPPLFPDRAALERALGRAVGGYPLRAALASAAQEACPAPDGDDWLMVACFALELDSGREHVTDLIGLHGTATLLHQAALVQELLLREIGAQLEAGALVDGPEIAGLFFEKDTTTPDLYHLVLPLSAPVLPETVPNQAFTLHHLDGGGAGWIALCCATLFEAAPPRLTIAVDGTTLVDGGRYRVSLDQTIVTLGTPIVDGDLRPLRPLRPSFHFRIGVNAAGDFVLADPAYVV